MTTDMSAADRAYAEGTRKMLISKDCAHARTETIESGHLRGLVRCLDCAALNPRTKAPVRLAITDARICPDKACPAVHGSEAHKACTWVECPMEIG